MKTLFTLLAVSVLVFLFPWTAPLRHRRYRAAAIWFILWAASWLCTFFLWFGPGTISLLALGLIATLGVTIPLRREPSAQPPPSEASP
jgi:hypothetical protein